MIRGCLRRTSLDMLLLMVLVSGCREVTSQASVVPPPITVGPSGGTLILADGAVALDVPAGALSSAVHIEARLALAYPAAGSFLVRGSVYELTPSGLTFAVPASLTLRRASDPLPSTVAESDLRMFTTATAGWSQVAGSRPVANSNGYVGASITALGVYGILAAPVASVSVSRDTVRAGSVGDLVQLTATARDAEGNVLPQRPIAWATSDSTHARVSAAGLVEALAGTSVITATSEGNSASTAVVLIPDSPRPTVLEDFSTYKSTADFLSDPLGRYRLSEDVRTNLIHIDPKVGYGSSPQSMRYDFPDRTNDPNRCADDTRTRWLRVIPGSDAAPQHIWAEVYYKFSVGFTQFAPASWNCSTEAPGYKLLFGMPSAVDTTHQYGRFNITSVYGDWNLGWPDDEEAVSLRDSDPGYGPNSYYPIPPVNTQGIVVKPGISTPRAGSMYDGKWHQVRVEWKVSSALDVPDGIARFWFDGVLAFDSNDPKWNKPIVVNRGGIYALALGANMNQGPGAPQSLWYGRIRVFTQDPNW